MSGLRPATSLKKRLRHECFPVNFVKLLETLFFLQATVSQKLIYDSACIGLNPRNDLNKVTQNLYNKLTGLHFSKAFFSGPRRGVFLEELIPRLLK